MAVSVQRVRSTASGVAGFVAGVLILAMTWFLATGPWWQPIVLTIVLALLGVATRGYVPLLLVVLVSRWMSGQRMVGGVGYAPATFLTGAAPPALPPRRFDLPRVDWAYWPGWQRMLARWVATALTVLGALWPLVTGVAVAVVVASVAGVATVVRVRARLADRPIRVLAAPRQPVAALSTDAVPASAWISGTERLEV